MRNLAARPVAARRGPIATLHPREGVARWLVPLLLLLSGCLPAAYRRPDPLVPIVLPRDEAAHLAPIEWWYTTGHLEDASGNRYGFEVTFFKASTPPTLRLFGLLPGYLLVEEGHVAHVALSDLTAGSHRMAQRADFRGYRAFASYDRLDLRMGDWSLKRIAAGSYQLVASVGGDRFELILTPEKPPALHGTPPGLQTMASGGASAYYSYTRMRAEGTLLRGCGLLAPIDCRRSTVTGQAWHDHQWGDFAVLDIAGWDWLSLQLDSGAELMLFLFRAPSGEYLERGGSYVTAAGETLPLNADGFRFEATGDRWESTDTGAIYPSGWRLNVPRFGLDLEVLPLLPAQEMDTRATTGIVYWEGSVEARGSHTGLGFAELTNYDLYPFGQSDETTPLQPLRGPLGR